MDVKVNNSIPYQSQNNVHNASAEKFYNSGNDAVDSLSKNKNIVVTEKAMMDISDVKRFLYMLIGSEIKVESNSEAVGSTINKIA